MNIYNQLHKVYYYFFFFILFFPIKINDFSTQFICLLFCLISECYLNKGLLRVNKEIKIISIFLIFLICYSILITIINGNYEFFIPLRFARALISLIIIYMFFNRERTKGLVIIKSILDVLLTHAILIIAGKFIPNISIFLSSFNGYNKILLENRCSGLVSGFEIAGFLCLLGLLVNIYLLVDHNNKLLNLKTIIFIGAICFTSRTSMLTLAVSMLLLFFYFLINHKKKYYRQILIIMIPFVIFFSSIIILSTEFGISQREKVLSLFPKLNKILINFLESYTDYGKFSNSWKTEISFGSSFTMHNFILGMGSTPSIDSGVIKGIYQVGIIGYLIILTIFLYIIEHAKKRINKQGTFIIYLIVLILFIYEFKGQTLFSSTFWEVTISLYFCFKLLSKKKLGVLKEYENSSSRNRLCRT